MAELTPLRVLSHCAIDVSANEVAASAGGDTYKNNGNVRLFVKTGGTPVDVTISGIVDNNRRTGDTTLTVPANSQGYFTPSPALLYGQTVNISYDQVTDVKVLAIIEE